MNDVININDIWFPAAHILYYGEKKLKTQIAQPLKKQIREAMAVAIMMIGIDKQTGKNHWVQTVDPKEETPDARTMELSKSHNGSNILIIQDVEVVTLEINSQDDVDDFLRRTKLGTNKSYPPKTTILCNIDKNVRQAKSWNDVHRSLSTVSVPNDVFVLARVDPIEQKYQLVEVYPRLGMVEFDIYNELFSKPKQEVLKLHRGTDTDFKLVNETFIPFQ